MGKMPKKLMMMGIGVIMVFVLGLFLSTTVSELVSAHGGDGSKIHVCINQNNGLMIRVGRDNDCSKFPPGWFADHWAEQGPPGPPGEGSTPSGAVMSFNRDSCPVGWSEFVEAQGRTIVGAPPDNIGGIVGLRLGNLENREHTHGPQPLSTSSDGEHNHQWSEFVEEENHWTSFNRDGGFDFVIFTAKGFATPDGGSIFPFSVLDFPLDDLNSFLLYR